MTTTTLSEEVAAERAVAASLKAQGAAAGIQVRSQATSQRAIERHKRLQEPRLSPETSYWVSPLETIWAES